MLVIPHKLALILDPIILKEVPVMVRELLIQVFGLLVVELPVPVELLVQPLAVVRGVVLGVEEDPLAVDPVPLEVALVVGPVAVDQLAVALLQTVLAHPLVLHAVLVELLEVDQVGFFLLHHGGLDLLLDGG